MSNSKINFTPKIWFFDMEGTLLQKDFALDNGKVAPSAWTVLAKLISEECYLKEELSKDRWNAGGYNGYLDWMKDTIRIQQEHGIKKWHVDEIVKSAKLHNGAHELIKSIKATNAKVVLISGGIKALADKVQRELKIDHAFSACEYFFDDCGNLDFYNLLPTDNEGKASFMQQIAKEYGVPPSECAFVGDGKNDKFLARVVGLSIAFNAQKELVEVSNYSIVQPQGREDLSVIKSLPFFVQR
ncbi:HAD-IB family phosphatase [Pseudoalteromonas sp. S4741]|uniref:HAD family hydrolase n=1 Tax=Pseudoalteromonas sp. S4741 TaxID=579563 RepID=UPI00110AC794|nr:HAD-IB family phosphatase [Pseudoalteromonas sp. S4741]TMO22370.1 phosphoserine phosphatase [Pseudoalteromonas sp. S4741]